MDVVEEFHDQIDYDAHGDCENKYEKSNDCIECCQKPYFEKISIDYTCAQKRKLYVIRYAPAYISEVKSALRVTPRDYIDSLLAKDEVRVASIGGGPGTDIAAFKQWLSVTIEDKDRLNKVRFLRVDIHEDWDDISSKLLNLYNIDGIDYEYKKIKQDICSQQINSKSFDSFDVIMISYLISEIDNEDLEKFAKNIANFIPEKALVVVNDRPQAEVVDKIDIFLDRIGGNNPKIIKPSERDHCGETYPDDIYVKAGVTIFRKSIRYNVLVEK